MISLRAAIVPTKYSTGKFSTLIKWEMQLKMSYI